MCWFSLHMKQLFSPAGYPMTQFWHDLPEDSIRFHGSFQGFSPTRLISTSIPDQKARLLSRLLTNYLEVSTSLIHGSVNVIEKLTELGIFREIFYFWGYQFIIKGLNSGTARWKRHTGQDIGEACGAPTSPSVPFYRNIHVFPNLEALWIPSFCVFMEVSLCKYDQINL